MYVLMYICSLAWPGLAHLLYILHTVWTELAWVSGSTAKHANGDQTNSTLVLHTYSQLGFSALHTYYIGAFHKRYLQGVRAYGWYLQKLQSGQRGKKKSPILRSTSFMEDSHTSIESQSSLLWKCMLAFELMAWGRPSIAVLAALGS